MIIEFYNTGTLSFCIFALQCCTLGICDHTSLGSGYYLPHSSAGKLPGKIKSMMLTPFIIILAIDYFLVLLFLGV